MRNLNGKIDEDGNLIIIRGSEEIEVECKDARRKYCNHRCALFGLRRSSGDTYQLDLCDKVLLFDDLEDERK